MPKLLVFDTETTGLPKSKIINPVMFHLWPHIVQFSYIIYDTDSNAVLKTSDFVVKVPPNVVISEESIKIHGVTNEMSQTTGIEIGKALEEFYKDILKVDVIIGHNIQFDINMLKIELLRLIETANLSNLKIRMYKDILYQVTYIIRVRCTMEETKTFCNILTQSKKGESYVKFPSLLELYQKLFAETPHNLHNSLHDVLVTLVCFIKFNYKVNLLESCTNVKTLFDSCGIV